ncbi:hypothetical protein STRCI_000180 [Streptomyces cinnabarinus]|uniref:Uncharacterized protein n=1 Tax=Streptomyces cinnabarinus TaxID=67287 RepID=A0ABY7K4S7_9ACTN|nr:hypothetical protein [Streptomyces cinnabarinus]WAZ19148.1 hypothetical protein STRCI_000180 [Streptomyces cinnabarinus]
MAAVVIVGGGGEEWCRSVGFMPHTVNPQGDGGGCAGGETSLDAVHMNAVRHEEAGQQHHEGQHARQRTHT